MDSGNPFAFLVDSNFPTQAVFIKTLGATGTASETHRENLGRLLISWALAIVSGHPIRSDFEGWDVVRNRVIKIPRLCCHRSPDGLRSWLKSFPWLDETNGCISNSAGLFAEVIVDEM